MKLTIISSNLILLLFMIQVYLASNSKLKMYQLNYKDKYDQCLNDYKKMYKMMDNKLKFYSQNENNLLESVKGTIFKAYEKSERLKDEHNQKFSELDFKVKNLENDIESKNKDLLSQKGFYEKKIKELEDSLTLRKNELNEITLNHKVLKEENQNNKNSLSDSKEQVKNYKILIEKKDGYYKDKLNLCIKEIGILTKDDKVKIENQRKFEANEQELKEMEEKLLKNREKNTDNYNNEIIRGSKLKGNLDLIENKLNSIIKSDAMLNSEMIKINNKKDSNTGNFDTIKINRFLEKDSHFSQMNNSTESQIQNLQRKENFLKTRLDFILFDDLDKTRKIYQKLNIFNNYIQQIFFEKEQCDNKLKKSMTENIELKEALAELEITFRLSKVKK